MSPDTLAALIAQGKTAYEIAAHFGCSHDTVFDRIHKWGLPMPRRGNKDTPIPADFVELSKTMTRRELEHHYGMSKPTIRNWQNRLGIERKHVKTGRPQKRSRRKEYIRRPVPVPVEEERIPLIDPRVRLDLALAVKAKRLGMPLSFVRGPWLQAHPDFLNEYPLAGRT